ncbi:MAG: hypothetical protein AMXMBFR4_16290 [Candidatus Hydrogenedentota bacterium]
MQAEDRPIHFSSELIHAPRSLPAPSLQKLYFELSRTKHANYLSSDFTPPGPPRFLTKRGKQTQSIVVFLPDRVVVAEEWVDIPFSTFLDRLETVAEKSLDELEIGPFVAQTAVIRTTFALTNYEDARVFLLDHACAQEGRIGPFLGRPIAVGGLRFVLPETQEHRGNLHVTIESFRYSRNEVFVEVRGIFAGPAIHRDTLSLLRDNFLIVRTFINERVHPYLAQFDVPVEGTA